MAKTVIHISHVQLPDPRIERIACLERKYFGYKPIIYIGGGIGKCFDRIIEYPKNIKAVGYRERKKIAMFLKEIIDEYQPDYIHVHDIFAAYPVMELGIDFLYDDHELHFFKNKDLVKTYLSLRGLRRYLKLYDPVKFFSSIAERLYKYLAMKRYTWKIVGVARAIVVISPTMKMIYKNFFGVEKVFVVPNFPIKEELPNIDIILSGLYERDGMGVLRLVYTTGNFRSEISGVIPYRDIGEAMRIFSNIKGVTIDVYSKDNGSGAVGLANVYMKGYIPRDKLISTLVRYHAGIVPFRPSLTHTIGGSNKVIEYLHAGLPVIFPRSYTGMLMLLQGFEELLYTYSDVSPFIFSLIINKIREFYIGGGIDVLRGLLDKIRKSLIMENYIDELKAAYSS